MEPANSGQVWVVELLTAADTWLPVFCDPTFDLAQKVQLRIAKRGAGTVRIRKYQAAQRDD